MNTTERTAEWKFTGTVAPEREARLRATGSFRDIITQITAGQVGALYWEPATAQHLKGCHRASFDLLVLSDSYDAFFKAPAGYRGQFAVSEGRG